MSIQLQSASYYEKKLRDDIRTARRVQAKTAMGSIIQFTLFVVLASAAFVAFSSGAFENVDVLGAVEFGGAVLQQVANNVQGFLKSWA